MPPTIVPILVANGGAELSDITGHIYLGIVKRGIAILIIGIALWIVVAWFLPVPFSLAIGIAYWIWQICDLFK